MTHLGTVFTEQSHGERTCVIVGFLQRIQDSLDGFQQFPDSEGFICQGTFLQMDGWKEMKKDGKNF